MADNIKGVKKNKNKKKNKDNSTPLQKKNDEFIQNILNEYKYHDERPEFYDNTGDNADLIISHNPTIPDLVIYNKGFNKNSCFYGVNIEKENIFPRMRFYIRFNKSAKIKYNKLKSDGRKKQIEKNNLKKESEKEKNEVKIEENINNIRDEEIKNISNNNININYKNEEIENKNDNNEKNNESNESNGEEEEEEEEEDEPEEDKQNEENKAQKEENNKQKDEKNKQNEQKDENNEQKDEKKEKDSNNKDKIAINKQDIHIEINKNSKSNQNNNLDKFDLLSTMSYTNTVEFFPKSYLNNNKLNKDNNEKLNSINPINPINNNDNVSISDDLSLNKSLYNNIMNIMDSNSQIQNESFMNNNSNLFNIFKPNNSINNLGLQNNDNNDMPLQFLQSQINNTNQFNQINSNNNLLGMLNASQNYPNNFNIFNSLNNNNQLNFNNFNLPFHNDINIQNNIFFQETILYLETKGWEIYNKDGNIIKKLNSYELFNFLTTEIINNIPINDYFIGFINSNKRFKGYEAYLILYNNLSNIAKIIDKQIERGKLLFAANNTNNNFNTGNTFPNINLNFGQNILNNNNLNNLNLKNNDLYINNLSQNNNNLNNSNLKNNNNPSMNSLNNSLFSNTSKK